MKIFILEDEGLVRWSLSITFEKRGHCVVAASTVGEARTLVKKDRFDIYLVDIFLPDCSGLEFIDFLKKHHPEARIFILTAYDDFQAVRRKYLAGSVNGLIKKPFNVAEIISVVESGCSRC